MLDLEGTELTSNEIANLKHSMVGGVILFSRNFESKLQLIELVASIRAASPNLLIAVDHEGGRVQRFKEGFTHIPAMGAILPATNNEMTQAKKWAKELGFLMAVELLSCDIDLSFAPVLDVDGVSDVIGRRSFSSDPLEVIELANAFIDGMSDAGMGAVGKHYPGHGTVKADSHIKQPIDERAKNEIFEYDILPFKSLITNKQLKGIMPAHVVYSKVDVNPAGFSEYWLQTVLRGELGFDGVIFSDDLGMEGATIAGNFKQRADAALNAGCDMILVCNNSEAANLLLNDYVWPESQPLFPASLLKPDNGKLLSALENLTRWQMATEVAQNIWDISEP